MDMFVPYTLQQEAVIKECLSTDCYQSTQKAAYSQTRSGLTQINPAAVLQLPLTAAEGINSQTYDVQTGYARSMSRSVEYKLATGDYFFLQEPFDIPDQPNPITAMVNTTFSTDSTMFYSEFYPSNGTISVPTGQTKTVNGPKGLRKPMQVVWISVAVMVMVLSIVVFGFFVHRFI